MNDKLVNALLDEYFDIYIKCDEHRFFDLDDKTKKNTVIRMEILARHIQNLIHQK